MATRMHSAPTPAEAKRIDLDEVRAIAKEAFIFGLPLVYIALDVETSTNVDRPYGMHAPINQFAHVRDFPDAANNPIVGMNVDTLYSLARLDLLWEPTVLSVPEMGSRWWIMQLIDAWNDVPAAPGTRTVGSHGGDFVLVGPHWQGIIPEGLTKIRVDTNLLTVAGRTFTRGAADLAAVRKIQNGYRLTPLSRWGHAYTPPENVPIHPGVDTRTPVPRQVFAMSPKDFFSRLNSLLLDNPPRPADFPTLERIARIGIAPGATFSSDTLDAETRAAIEQGMEEARRAIRDEKARMGEMVNGWQIARDLGHYGTKYLYRATWTYFAVGGNVVEDACYPVAIFDSEGEPLSGANDYVLRFAKEELPPARYFWSLTMYDGDSYLVPNRIDRYALGDRSDMTWGDDGSLTIYIQQESPGADKEANWLPAPAGAITLALRIYGPEPSVADGSWRPPGIQKVG
jgi:hypothetical protein